jgi:uncharacterized protein DUF4157
MTAEGLRDLFALERRRFRVRAGLSIDTRRPRSARAMAYTVGRRVYFYDRALELPASRLRALVRHELAHVALIAARVAHSERDADQLAEQLGGGRIRYDGRGIQTLGPGCWPRPRRLR